MMDDTKPIRRRKKRNYPRKYKKHLRKSTGESFCASEYNTKFSESFLFADSLDEATCGSCIKIYHIRRHLNYDPYTSKNFRELKEQSEFRKQRREKWDKERGILD